MGALGVEEPDGLSEQALRTVLGLLDLTGSGLRRLLGPPEPTDVDVDDTAPGRQPGLRRLVPCAAVALGVAAQRRSARAVSGVGSRLGAAIASAARPVVTHEPFVSSWRLLVRWGEQGAAERARNRDLAAGFVRAVAQEVASGVLAQVDLDGAADRIDLDRAVRRLDLDLAADRLDVDRVASRLDVDRVAARIDVDRVAARVDVDAVVARADLDAVIARLDLADLVRRVLDEIDFARLVRESSGTMAVETVDAFRDRGVTADRILSRIADRVLSRSTARNTAGPPHRPEER
ncbi:hypothetical protein [Streptomyces flavofungini]|uniref:Uncharacterized protein n=1 Tax=Streptomyces flavofungini TaxID=68200 RepID=A0ABS0X968_9ACTN|nr:hypothetical protein [Streptomyces flavofungini]MBJ3809694.1 hypothetical protein [Streptomyces flavofungini]GHC80137.1 hypothetical protein GCM10010349_62410 [Streptomyces flavofungini]